MTASHCFAHQFLHFYNGTRTNTWIDDVEARPNVSYVLASGSALSFGESSRKHSFSGQQNAGQSLNES
jgi:hypothetical protein